ncbi:hypothetical protein [Cohnella massiliensis]|uniref:hypothetical protein n=1 Tax=Cohnella massiliensis TaxID=1816691 RepID=UPI0009BB124E|nr:hypothetical protein [Cohnella massiliensis]
MNNAELAALKETLKAEIMAEIKAESPVKIVRDTTAWDGVKQLIIDAYPHKRTFEHYQIISGLSPVIRYIFGVCNFQGETLTN